MRRALVAVVVLVIAVVAVWLLRRPRAASTAATSHAAADSAAAAKTTTAPSARAPAAPPLRLPSARVVADAKPAAGAFGGRVLSAESGQPIARASLTFLHQGAAISTETDGSGRYLVTAASPGVYELASASATGYLPFEPQLGHSPVTVQARAGVRL